MHQRQLMPDSVAARLLGALAAVCLVAVVVAPSTALADSQRPHWHGSGKHANALLVNFRGGVDDAAAAAAVKNAGATEIGRLDDLGTRVVEVPDSRRDSIRSQLANDPRVVSVEEDATAQAALIPTDPRWYQAWGPVKVGAPKAWNVTTGSKKTVIAVVDTGVDPKQPDLRGRVLPGWDFVNDDANAKDDDNHGTAVAGVAAAAANDGVGIAGMCWKCRILPVKVLNSHGSGTHSNIAAGIVWAVDHGADVINLSIAGPRTTTVLESAIKYALKHGVVVVAAAGNEGSRKKFYPAAYAGVMSVAATNKKDKLYNWSNRGSYVKLAAPGCAVTGKPGAHWTRWCGTSFATPIVAGTAALIKSRKPGMARSKIEKLLLTSTLNVRGIGGGRIKAGRALTRAAGSKVTTSPDPTPKPTATPKATPKPTATPTPRPTSTPTPSATPTPSSDDRHVWRSSLDDDRHHVERTYRLSGHVEFRLTWSANHGMGLHVTNSDGEMVLHEYERDGEIEASRWLRGDDYTVSIGQWSDDWTSFKLVIQE